MVMGGWEGETKVKEGREEGRPSKKGRKEGGARKEDRKVKEGDANVKE
jgi:hypothetical protein